MDDDTTTPIPSSRPRWRRLRTFALGAVGLVALSSLGYTALTGGDNVVSYVAMQVGGVPDTSKRFKPKDYDGHGSVPRPQTADFKAAYEKTTTEYAKDVRPPYPSTAKESSTPTRPATAGAASSRPSRTGGSDASRCLRTRTAAGRETPCTPTTYAS